MLPEEAPFPDEPRNPILFLRLQESWKFQPSRLNLKSKLPFPIYIALILVKEIHHVFFNVQWFFRT